MTACRGGSLVVAHPGRNPTRTMNGASPVGSGMKSGVASERRRRRRLMPETDTLPPIGGIPRNEATGTPKRPGKRRPAGTTPKPPQPEPLASIPTTRKEPSPADVENCWGQILSFTALIHTVDVLPDLKCTYCRDHILKTAPGTAKSLVKLSADYPMLHGVLVNVTRFFAGASLLGEVGNLYGPSVMHHGPEVSLLTGAATVMYPDMPPRQPKRKSMHPPVPAHSHAQQPAPSPPPSPTVTPAPPASNGNGSGPAPIAGDAEADSAELQ
jgi:hypothetical protein